MVLENSTSYSSKNSYNIIMKRLLEVLPKIAQWDSIPYAADFSCQSCGNSGIDSRRTDIHKPILIGWCETNYGFMGVYECPMCGAKYRFHAGDAICTKEEFENLLPFYFGERCENWDEIENELKN